MIITNKYIRKKFFHFFHTWKEIQNTGTTYYYECEKCRARKVIQICSVYQLIDWEWLYFRKNKIGEN